MEILEGLNFSDITHGYSWSKNDYDKIKKINDLIKFHDKRKEYDEKRCLIRNYEDKLTRIRNDQTVEDLEPLDFTTKVDRIVNAGRTRAAELIAGEAARRFDFAAIGVSKLKVFDGDFKLGQEVSRINIKDNGFVSAAGAVIKHSGTWTPSIDSLTIWEFAPVDLPAYNINQMIWARVVFPETKPLVHIQNEDFFTITHSAFTSSSV